MSVTLKRVDAIMRFFQEEQLKHGHQEYGNIVAHKWNMLAVARQIGAGRELRQLIQFFMLTSDDRSYDHFFQRYHEYFETMNRVKEDRAHRKYLAQKTAESMKETTNSES